MNDVKWEHVILIVILISLVAAGFIMGLRTMLIDKQDRIEIQQQEKDELVAHIYWMGIKLLPPPYSRPLKHLWISSGTGFRTDPLGGVNAEEKLHRGIDLAAPVGAPVHAILAGRVAEHYVPPDGGKWKGHPIMGGYIVIDHRNELLSEYAHLSITYVHEGDWVEMGEVIGLVGDTGICTGPHLHIAIVVSPIRYLEERR